MRKPFAMLARRILRAKVFVLAIGAAALSALPAHAQIGPILLGPGPVNRSMGGASVAAPIDSLGALYWNPATITALPSSMDFGMEILMPRTTLASSVPANGFGPGLPPIPLSGSTASDAGVFALPSIGLVYSPEASPLTFGFGAFPVAGFGTNYPASTTNPILSPQPPNGLGLGALYSNFQALQLAPTVALKVTDQLSIAAGPTVDLAALNVDPLLVAAANTNGSYPPGTHSRFTWGAGFQAGVYYILDGGWGVGASFKSQQWFENYHWQTVDQFGRPRTASYHLDLPMIPSIGIGYSGIDRLLLAADLRYVDFHNTPGLSQGGFAPTGAANGLGWNSVFAMSLGAQYLLTDALSVRAGYAYNGNPIPDSQSTVNVLSPTIVEHTVSIGASYRVTECFSLSLAYAHGFQNSIQGPLVTPFGAVPGSSVRSQTMVDSILFGASVRFGPRAGTTPQ
jgi:long-chain fatty acid transport protein